MERKKTLQLRNSKIQYKRLKLEQNINWSLLSNCIEHCSAYSIV